MSVFCLLAGEYVKTINGRVCVPIPLAPEGAPYFLVCLDVEQRTELERQSFVLKQPVEEVLTYVLNYGFNSMETLKELMRSADGGRSE